MPKVIATLDEFKAEVLNAPAGKLVVVDFWATWCPPCLGIAAYYEELAGNNSDVHFCKVDVDANRDTTEYAKINCMPTFKFYKNGQLLETIEGASRQKIAECVQKYK